MLFYNPAKSKFDADDYLVTVPYDPKKGLSREYLAYFAQTLNDVAIQGLDDLMDFLTDETATDFSLGGTLKPLTMVEQSWKKQSITDIRGIDRRAI